MKTKIFVVIGSCLLLLQFVLSAGSSAFRDVPKGHWAEDAVNELQKEGVGDGFSDRTFRGHHYLSRYEMVVWLDRLEEVLLKRLAVREKLARELAAEAADLNREIKSLKTLTK